MLAWTVSLPSLANSTVTLSFLSDGCHLPRSFLASTFSWANPTETTISTLSAQPMIARIVRTPTLGDVPAADDPFVGPESFPSAYDVRARPAIGTTADRVVDRSPHPDYARSVPSLRVHAMNRLLVVSALLLVASAARADKLVLVAG